MSTAEDQIIELDKARAELVNVKCNQLDFKEFVDRVENIMTDFDQRISTTKNHCVAIDNYLDKYQPVRMQAMIGDTLNACLMDETRRRHEIYDQDKISLLYQVILEDDGQGENVQRMII